MRVAQLRGVKFLEDCNRYMQPLDRNEAQKALRDVAGCLGMTTGEYLSKLHTDGKGVLELLKKAKAARKKACAKRTRS